MVARVTHLALSCLLVAALSAHADDVRVMTSGATAAAHLDLAPAFERASGHRVVTLATSTGVGQSAIASRIRGGEAVDVLILPRAALDDLTKDGKVIADSRVDLARSRIGMAVKKGAPKPDISTVDALTRTLRSAKSVAVSAQVSGVYLIDELFPRLGLAEVMKPKTIRVEVGRAGSAIVRGEAEIAFQQLSELMEVPEIELVGPLPAEVQRVTVVAAGVVAGSRSPAAARAYIEFLRSAEGLKGLTKSGLDPLSSR